LPEAVEERRSRWQKKYYDHDRFAQSPAEKNPLTSGARAT
jgi:hypothetical protein